MQKTRLIILLSITAILCCSNLGYAISIGSSIEDVKERIQGYQNISPASLMEMIKQNDDVLTIDVRNSSEYKQGHIVDAISFPLKNMTCGSCLTETLTQNQDNNIVVYCKSGYRSKLASRILVKKGFKQVYNLEGGINAWIDEGFQLIHISDSNSDYGCHDVSNTLSVTDRSLGSFSVFDVIKKKIIDTKDRATYELQKIRDALNKKNVSWTAGHTSVSDLTKKQFKVRLGLIDDELDAESYDKPNITLSVGASSHVDWRSAGKMTSVKNQGSCGSCWAFAVLGTVESLYKIKASENLNLAEQHLVSCETHSDGCDGGYLNHALDFVKDTGVVDEDVFPYKASDYYCTHPERSNPVTKILGYNVVSGRENIKTSIEKNGPVVAGFKVYRDFQYYDEGVYQHVSGGYRGKHAVVIAGYKDTPGEYNGGYWICKNSWGSSWGEEGYFRIAYGECGIDDSVYTVTVEGNDPDDRSITVTSPRAGDSWEKGKQYEITWNSVGTIRGVDIDLYHGRNKVQDLSVLYEPDDGRFTWTIDDGITSGEYKIKITSNDGEVSDYSPVFEITGDINPDSIMITSPTGGEQWKVGSSHQIKWRAGASIETVNIKLYRSLFPVLTIAEDISAQSGSYSWTIPNSQATGTFKVKVASTSDTSINDYSGEFQITNNDPTPDIKVSITKPEPGYLYLRGLKIHFSDSSKTILIGKMTIKANVQPQKNVGKVAFYVDNELEIEDKRAPYQWEIEKRLIGKHTINVIAYDEHGSAASDDMQVFGLIPGLNT